MWDTNYEDTCLDVGSKFNNAEEFRLRLRQFIIKHNFNSSLQKNDGKAITTKCTDGICKWYVKAAMIPHKVTYEVRVFQEKHSAHGSKTGIDVASSK